MQFIKDKVKKERRRRRKLRKHKARALPEGVGPAEYDEKAKEALQGEILMFSGCADSQTSADVHDVGTFGLPEADGAGGACTHALLKAIMDGAVSYIDILKDMREILKTKRFTQLPQLSASRRLDLRQAFEPKQSRESRTKALLVGINYVGQQGELGGCWHDVKAFQTYLMEKGEFDFNDPSRYKILMDDGDHERPTAQNIIDAFAWLTDDAQPGDSLWFSYSGHGGSVGDQDGDEDDGLDETLVPVDYQESGQIRDDTIFARLVAPVPAGVRLTCVLDCCHSGTVLDLPYIFSASDNALQTIAENPDQAATLQPNQAFSFEFLLNLAKNIYSMHSQGKTPQEISMFVGRSLGIPGM